MSDDETVDSPAGNNGQAPDGKFAPGNGLGRPFAPGNKHGRVMVAKSPANGKARRGNFQDGIDDHGDGSEDRWQGAMAVGSDRTGRGIYRFVGQILRPR